MEFGFTQDDLSGRLTSRRPTPQESERQIERDFGWQRQQSYKDRLDANYGEKGSVRPDLTNPTEDIQLDVKNYDLTNPRNRFNLYNDIEEQAAKRAANLPSGSFQGIILDIRGQNVDPAVLQRIPINIETRAGGIIPRTSVVYRTENGYMIPYP
jgi:filamentous hemagglutinin